MSVVLLLFLLQNQVQNSHFLKETKFLVVLPFINEGVIYNTQIPINDYVPFFPEVIGVSSIHAIPFSSSANKICYENRLLSHDIKREIIFSFSAVIF